MTSRDVGTVDFLAVSPWVVRPVDLQPPLRSHISASFAVIGAGYTGLSAALALKGAGADVVVVEREFAGFGASGRNAGHLTPTIGKDLPTLMLFGKRRAAQLVRFADEAVRHVESLIEQYRIECDYVPSGNIMAAVHPKHEARLRHAATVAAQIGAHVRFLSRDEMRARGIPPSFLAGALEESGARRACAIRTAALWLRAAFRRRSRCWSVPSATAFRNWATSRSRISGAAGSR